MSVLALAAATFGAGALQAWQTYQEGQYEKDIAGVEAQSIRQQAQYAQQTAGQQIAQQDYEAAHQLASARAGVAASGISETEGSPELIQYTSANQQRINDMYTKYAANVESAGFDTQAALTQSAGEQAARGAEAGATLGLVSSGINAYTGAQYGYGYGGGYSAGMWNWMTSPGGPAFTTGIPYQP